VAPWNPSSIVMSNSMLMCADWVVASDDFIDRLLECIQYFCSLRIIHPALTPPFLCEIQQHTYDFAILLWVTYAILLLHAIEEFPLMLVECEFRCLLVELDSTVATAIRGEDESLIPILTCIIHQASECLIHGAEIVAITHQLKIMQLIT